MSEYSVNVSDWHEEDKWLFTGREVMLQKKGEWADDNQNGLQEEDEFPMMNYAYPLYDRPSDEQIVAICSNTNCTVVENNDTGKFFLALTGGGMDLSQDIALAYILADERVPASLALEVSKQYGLSKSNENWFKVAEACKKSLQVELDWCIRGLNEWDEAIREGKGKERADNLRFKAMKKAKKQVGSA